MTSLGLTCRGALVVGWLATGVAAAGAPPVKTAPVAAHDWKWVGDRYGMDESDEPAYPRAIEQTEFRRHAGDDPRWADPNFDDGGWERVPVEEALPSNVGIFWIRLQVRNRGDRGDYPSLLRVACGAAYEFFWDGEKILQSGRPGSTRAAEIPGPVVTLLSVPGRLLGPGPHVLALRMSTYYVNRPAAVMPLNILGSWPGGPGPDNRRNIVAPVLVIGGMLVVGLATLFVWTVSVRRGVLLRLASLCLCAALMEGLRVGRYLVSLPYSYSYPVWCAISFAAFAFAALYCHLIMAHFEVKRQRLVLGGLVLVDAVAFWMYPETDGVHLAAAWAAALLVGLTVTVWAAWQRRLGARYMLVGQAVSAALYGSDPINFGLWYGTFQILPALGTLAFALALRLRDEQRMAREVRLAAGRLEAELLKKSLQPHFLMNTLTVLAQAVEENPAIAARLIDDLANVLRAMVAFADRRLVSLAEEIELCRAHLRVMSIRTERPWRLDAIDTEAGSMVPPALFLTLIENGFAHQKADPATGVFTLRAERRAGGVSYEFFSPGAVRDGPGRTDGGMGLRYVRARLAETCAQGWGLEQSAAPGGWRTMVRIHDAATDGAHP